MTQDFGPCPDGTLLCVEDKLGNPDIVFPSYVLKILKLCLFYLPMLVDYCTHKLFAHKIPMYRKWVRLKCASHMLHDAPLMFQFLSFM